MTTIFPGQAHYVLTPGDITASYPTADITLERIGELVNADSATLLGNDAAHRVKEEPL